MSNVYILSEHGKLSKCDEHFLFRDMNGAETRILPTRTDLISINSHVSITGEALALLAKSKVPVIFHAYGNDCNILFQYGEAKNVFLRQKQYRLLDDDGRRLSVARSIVCGKIKNQVAFLQKIRRRENDAEKKEKFWNAIMSMKAVMNDSENADCVERLRGFEGIASRNYFSVFALHLKPEWACFPHRSKNPPESNVNAVLSFLYVLLSQNVTAATVAQGLDSMAGTLHELSYGKDALVFDLMEEFRTPISDAVCCKAFNDGVLCEDDFVKNENAVYMTRDGLKKVTRMFDEKLESEYKYHGEGRTYSQILFMQAQLYKDCILSGKEYVPFSYK